MLLKLWFFFYVLLPYNIDSFLNLSGVSSRILLVIEECMTIFLLLCLAVLKGLPNPLF